MADPLSRRDFLVAPFALTAAGALLISARRVSGQSRETAQGPSRLYFWPERVVALGREIRDDAVVRVQWQEVLARADHLLGTPLPSQAEADRGSGANASFPAASRQLVEISFTVGLAWQVTREERYAARLREALLHAIGYERWQGRSFFARQPAWNSSLWTAAFTVGCAAGVDALAGWLSAEDRTRILNRMTQLGVEPLLDDWVLPRQRIHALDSMGHNWWSVCVSGAGVGALALLQHEPRAAGWIREIDAAMEAFFAYGGMPLLNKPANFDPAGGFYEGAGYANYTLVEYLIYRLARNQAAGLGPAPEIPVLERAAEFLVQCTYPATDGDLALNFGDSALRRSFDGVVRHLAAQGFSAATAAWFLGRPGGRGRPDPLLLLHRPSAAAAASQAASPPLTAFYGTIGWAMLRDSWRPDATLLAVKCGDTWNHAHADAGSFVLFHRGKPLLIDSGACSYGRPEYRGYYVQSRAHNVVLFEGQGQPAEDFDRGVRLPGRLHGMLDGLGVRYLFADASGPMARHLVRNFRHWLWIDGAIVIFDDLLAHQPGRFDWLLHYEGEITRTNESFLVRNGPAAAQVRLMFPECFEAHTEEGLAEEAPDRKVPYLRLSTCTPARDQKFIAVIVPGPADQPTLRVDRLNEPKAPGVRLRRGDTVTDVYLNIQADGRRMHLNSDNKIAGWETDAYILALTRRDSADHGDPTRVFLAGGSYLRRDGWAAFDSHAKVDLAFRPGAEWDVALVGPNSTRLAFGARSAPRSLALNGAPVPFDYSPTDGLLQFRWKPSAPR